MARDLKLGIDGNSAGGQKALEEAAAAAAAAAREADRLGDQFKQAQRDAAALDRQLLETAAAAKALAIELAKNPADAGLKKQLDAQRKAAGELKRLRQEIVGDTEKAAGEASRLAGSAANDLEKLTARAAREAAKNAERIERDTAKAAKQTAANLAKAARIANPGEGFSFGALGEAAPELGAAAAGPGLALAGGATAAIAGAGAAGLGVAGAVLGNPQAFQSAWEDALGVVKKDFLDASEPFTGVTLDAIKTIGPLIDSWDLSSALAPAVKYVPQLVAGIEGFASGVEHGAAVLISRAGPAVTALSDGMVRLGDAADTALSLIADGADGGAAALADTLTAVSYVVAGFGAIVDAAEHAYSFVQDHPIAAALATGGLTAAASIWSNALGDADDAGQSFGHTLQGVALTGDIAADAAKKQADDFASLAKELNAASVNADTLAGGMTDKLLGSLLASDEAALGFQESLTRADEALKENKRNLDIHSAAGQADREAILGIVQANIRTYDTMIAAGSTAVEAAQAYDQNTAALEANLRKAGLTQQAIDGLIGKYRSVPDRVNTDIAVNGLEVAIRDLNTTLKLINGIHDRNAVIDVTTVYHVKGSPNVGEGGTRVLRGAERYGGIRRAAQGMLVPPSDPGTVLFGEPQTGGEAFIPLRGISPDRAASLAQTVGDSYGFDVRRRGRIPSGLFGTRGAGAGAVTPQLVYSGSGGGLDALFASWMAHQLRTGALQLMVDPSGQVRAA